MLWVYNVSKAYGFNGGLRRRFRRATQGEGDRRVFWALRDVNLSLTPGEVLGIIGPNGSGKSTLLQIVAGVLQPTAGRIAVHGRTAALLELGAGFNPEFTGRENVYFGSELMGRPRHATEAVFPDIEEFAGIGAFIDRPVREYSSGMYVRLAFSAAIHVQPDVLIVDEALAVGDAAFSGRCIRRLEEMRDSGVTILFVSHDLGIVKRLCNRAVLMNAGRIVAEGEPADVVNRYIAWVHEGDAAAVERYSARERSHGDDTSRIQQVDLLDDSGESVRTVRAGAHITVRVGTRFTAPVDDPIVGLLIRDRLGSDVYGTNTLLEQVRAGHFDAGDILCVDFHLSCTLAPQKYTITAAIQHSDGRSQDWRDDVVTFSVVGDKHIAGLADLGAEVEYRKLTS